MKEEMLESYLDDPLVENIIEITLSFTGENLNKFEISEKLNLPATNAWNTNEILSTSAIGKLKIAPFGKWFFKFNTLDNNLNTDIQNFFKNLPQNPGVWLELSKKYTACIEIATYQQLWNHSYQFDIKTLKLISERNLHLSIDNYNILQSDNDFLK